VTNGSDERRLEVEIHGRVQGVGFRYFAQREAKRQGLGGWVRNRRTGEVQVVAEGPEDDLKKFLAEVRKGPPMAHVDHADVEWKQATNGFSSFDITYTA
jgi:acylphosphatase